MVKQRLLNEPPFIGCLSLVLDGARCCSLIGAELPVNAVWLPLILSLNTRFRKRIGRQKWVRPVRRRTESGRAIPSHTDVGWLCLLYVHTISSYHKLTDTISHYKTLLSFAWKAHASCLIGEPLEWRAHTRKWVWAAGGSHGSNLEFLDCPEPGREGH